jgi:hypothetical protein
METKPKPGWAAKELEIVRKQLAGPASVFFSKPVKK